MRKATVSLNRQVIRLCKGILKAWEQWVDEVELEATHVNSHESRSQLGDGKHNHNDRPMKL